MAPRVPLKEQKSILMGSLVVFDPHAPPKRISYILGTGCHKVCTCPLNGAICERSIYLLLMYSCIQTSFSLADSHTIQNIVWNLTQI